MNKELEKILQSFLTEIDNQKTFTIKTNTFRSIELYFLLKLGNLVDFHNFLQNSHPLSKLQEFFETCRLFGQRDLHFQKVVSSPKVEIISNDLAETVKKEQDIFQRIEKLKLNGTWRIRKSSVSLNRPKDIIHQKLYTDVMMDEMRWLSVDFCQEYRTKKRWAKILAKSISKHDYKKKSELPKREISVFRNVSKNSVIQSRCIKNFWNSAREAFFALKFSRERADHVNLLKTDLDKMLNKADAIAKGVVKLIDKYDESSSDFERELQDLNDQNKMTVNELVATLPEEYKLSLLKTNQLSVINDACDATLKIDTPSLDKIRDNAAKYQPQNPEYETNFKEPPLLRNRLRSYQLVGLSWLLSLHDNDLSGILADEMGLGKTIQTIALLSHLAEPGGIWGPHLIIVPSSVLLNWDCEFKKWCPGLKILCYYGTRHDRRLKRQGWSKLYQFHVCITTYSIVLQDYRIFKRKPWYYMILDEAHNIKNFKTQRWQALVGLNSQRRLLLTGTPLQNNLTDIWSLLNFVMPDHFNDYSVFINIFSKPIEQLINYKTSDEKLIEKFHSILRPFILRRLKSQVELQMPKKQEFIIKCSLSKRQRNLYDEFMSLDQTKQSIHSAKVLSVLQIILKLRKVCNHPDLFESRPVLSPFVCDFFTFHPPKLAFNVSSELPYAYSYFKKSSELEYSTQPSFDELSIGANCFAQKLLNLNIKLCPCKYDCTCEDINFIDDKLFKLCSHRDPTLSVLFQQIFKKRINDRIDSAKNTPTIFISTLPLSLSLYSNICDRIKIINNHLLFDLDSFFCSLKRFICITPRAICVSGDNPCTKYEREPYRFYPNHHFFNLLWPLYIDRFLLFPENSLIQYDCGKLQELEKLLKALKIQGHRVLIFTQMSKMLDILEKFLAYHSYSYLRIDGSTPVDQRHIISERFNSDPSIFSLVLSTRTGGTGMNLIGADTVIFYDIDWNPTADAQAQDRCHRIGQTRDVSIYRLICENTIEENIFDKANHKKLLNEIAIENARFTARTLHQNTIKDLFDENLKIFNKAMDCVFWENEGIEKKQVDEMLEKIEKQEDVYNDIIPLPTCGYLDNYKKTEFKSYKPIERYAMRIIRQTIMDESEVKPVDQKLIQDWNTNERKLNELKYRRKFDERINDMENLWHSSDSCKRNKKAHIPIDTLESNHSDLFVFDLLNDNHKIEDSELFSTDFDGETIPPVYSRGETVGKYFRAITRDDIDDINWDFFGYLLNQGDTTLNNTPQFYFKRCSQNHPINLNNIIARSHSEYIKRSYSCEELENKAKLKPLLPSYSRSVVQNSTIRIFDPVVDSKIEKITVDSYSTCNPAKVFENILEAKKMTEEKPIQLMGKPNTTSDQTLVLSHANIAHSISCSNIQNPTGASVCIARGTNIRIPISYSNNLKGPLQLLSPKEVSENIIRMDASKVQQFKDLQPQYLRLNTNQIARATTSPMSGVSVPLGNQSCFTVIPSNSVVNFTPTNNNMVNRQMLINIQKNSPHVQLQPNIRQNFQNPNLPNNFTVRTVNLNTSQPRVNQSSTPINKQQNPSYPLQQPSVQRQLHVLNNQRFLVNNSNVNISNSSSSTLNNPTINMDEYSAITSSAMAVPLLANISQSGNIVRLNKYPSDSNVQITNNMVYIPPRTPVPNTSPASANNPLANLLSLPNYAPLNKTNPK